MTATDAISRYIQFRMGSTAEKTALSGTKTTISQSSMLNGR